MAEALGLGDGGGVMLGSAVGTGVALTDVVAEGVGDLAAGVPACWPQAASRNAVESASSEPRTLIDRF